MQQYWIAVPGGEPKGPHSVDAIRSAYASGQISGDTLACPDGGTTWSPVSDLLRQAGSGSRSSPTIRNDTLIHVALLDGQRRTLRADALRQLVTGGKLSPDTTQCWTEGMQDWCTARVMFNIDSPAVYPPEHQLGAGLRIAPPSGWNMPQTKLASTMEFETELAYAGFWRRVAARFIDTIITNICFAVIVFIFGIIMAAGGTDDPDVLKIRVLLLGSIFIVVGWMYYAVMESSPAQGTLGKMALGIKVTDLDGKRVGFGKATGRHFGTIISGLLLLSGFIMVAFTDKKQGLHDMMAGCLVVNR